jgi:hypothetical protein
MNVKDNIRRSILLFPLIQQNVIDVLDQALLTIGGGYKWSYGELMEFPYTINKNRYNKIPTIEEALEINKRRRESDLEKIERNTPKRLRDISIESIKELEIKNSLIIKDIDNRVKDFTLHYTIQRRNELRIKPKPEPDPIFHPTFGWDNLSKVPVDVTEDWLEACNFLYNTMVNNINLVDPEVRESLPKYKERLDWIKEQRRIKKEDIRPGMILQLYNKAENKKDRVVVLKVKEKHIKEGLDAPTTGLYGFRGLWYGVHPEKPNCYGKMYDLSTYNEDEIELIRPDIQGLNCETIKFITK